MRCGAEVSDHFAAWMTLVGAGITLVTALATVALSAVIENRREAARRAHADQVEETRRRHEGEVRFHNERLAAYVEYIGAANAVFAAATMWVQRGGVGAFLDLAPSYLSSYTQTFRA